MSLNDKVSRRAALFGVFAESASIKPGHGKYDSIAQDLKRLEKLDPTFKRRRKEAANRALQIAKAHNDNGPDLFVDKYLRNLLREYNSRVLRGEGINMPSSVNVMQSFIEPDPTAFILRLLDERFYQLRFDDYMEFLTRPEFVAEYASLQKLYEELVIYEINMLGGFTDFQVPGEANYLFCGAGIVRERYELSLIGIFGKDVSTGTQSVPPEKPSPQNIAPGKEFLLRDTFDYSDDALFGNPAYAPVILMMRIDLSNSKIQIKYALEEKKDAFSVLSNDPDFLSDAKSLSGDDTIAETILGRLSEYESLFNILTHFSQFPFFLANHEDDIVLERHPTQFRANQASTETRKLRSALGNELCAFYREVHTLRSETGQPSGVFSIATPSLRMEKTGYWKMLPIGTVGADRFGQPVTGKTWVTTQVSWHEQPDAPDVGSGHVVVDTSASTASAIGYVYVMRSGLHPRDVYKVGFTLKTPEERAAELSATSGQPDLFTVIQAWKVRDPRGVEYQAHKKLAEFRINNRREFFNVKYATIRGAIEDAIENLGVSLED
jgi:hypothetical protein